MAKFKVGDKVVYRGGYKWDLGLKFRTITKELKGGGYRVDDLILDWEEDDLELYKEVKEMKELTFKEVIANIKEGEVWENKELELKITFKKNEFYIGDSNDNEINGYVGQFINNGLIFKLQRKEYTFEEAFKALEEGKEIESTESHAKYKKIDDCYKTSLIIGEWNFAGCLLNFYEIKGKWYINEVD